MANSAFSTEISTVAFADGETTILTAEGNYLLNGFIISNQYAGNTHINLSLTSGNKTARVLSNTVLYEGASLSVVGNGESLYAPDSSVIKLTVTSADGVVDVIMTLISV